MAEELLQRFDARFPRLGREEALRRSLSRQGRLVRLPVDQHICLEGSSCTHLAFLLEGTARIYKVGETGREITLYRIEPGECCILTLSCILTEKRFPAFAVAETELEAVVVPAATVRHWTDTLPGWRRYSWDLVADRLGNIISLVEEITFRRMDQRLEHHLARAELFPPGRRVSVTHQQIATELGTSREVVSRLLKDLEQKGKVELGRGWLKVNAPLLPGTPV
ncbi:MAG TPA: Crp/Fnr family transcriptional regulator, partial [Thiolapillus brandeum]|nr:Crp/Fnr family transcriptional regulator [Thiolapillus brandeum]